ncbi:MAG TPA: GAF domain-containing protein [Anaerolineales bacterium]|nr:GAF domain-containing protein [Anaerolineales bacterium]
MTSDSPTPAPANKPFTLVKVIGDLPSYQYCTDTSITVEKVVTHLKNNPELPGIVLCKGPKFVGMLSRAMIFEWLGRPYGIELFFKEPIGKLFSTLNILTAIAPRDMPIGEAVQSALSRFSGIRYEPLVVSFAENDLRLVEMNDLLLAQTEQLFNANKIIEKQIEIGKTLVSSLELSKVLDLILEQMESIIPYSRAAIMLHQNGIMEFAASHGYPENVDMEEARSMVNNNEVFSNIIKTQRPMTIKDTTLHPDWPHIPNTPPTRSWLGVPLVQNNTVLGMLVISRLTVAPFTRDEVKTSSIFSGQAAIALGNAHLYAEIKKINSQLDSQHQKLQEAVSELNRANVMLTRRAVQLETSNQISQQINSILDIKKLLSKIVSIVHDQFNYTWVSVWLMNKSCDSLVLEACRGASVKTGVSVRIGNKGLVAQACRTGEMAFDNNIARSSAFTATPGLPVAFSEIAFPLKFQNDVLGVLDLQSERIQAFNLDDVAVLQIAASQLAVAIQNARLYSELDRLSKGGNPAQERALDVS